MKPDRKSGQNTQRRYNRLSPPSTEKDALDRLAHLRQTAAITQGQLTRKRPEQFESDGAYEDWVQRTTAFKAHTDEEIVFLEEWAVRHSARAHARTLAEEIECSYTPIYPKIGLPATLEEAQQRQAQLAAIWNRLERALAEVTEDWTRFSSSRKVPTTVKAPLVRLIVAVQSEMSLVRGYIRTRYVPQWEWVLTRALARAIEEGFQLTEEEEQVYAQMKQYRENSKPAGSPRMP